MQETERPEIAKLRALCLYLIACEYSNCQWGLYVLDIHCIAYLMSQYINLEMNLRLEFTPENNYLFINDEVASIISILNEDRQLLYEVGDMDFMNIDCSYKKEAIRILDDWGIGAIEMVDNITSVIMKWPLYFLCSVHYAYYSKGCEDVDSIVNELQSWSYKEEVTLIYEQNIEKALADVVKYHEHWIKPYEWDKIWKELGLGKSQLNG